MARIGIALGGGAGLGWAHIGVIRVLEEENIPISAVAGTSIGAIVGACVADDRVDDLEEIARSISLKEMLALGEFGFNKGSLIGAGKIERKLREHFGTRTIQQLQKPFAAIAADLYTGTKIVLEDGDIVTALRASSAVPGVLPPVKTETMCLVDGGVIDPIPIGAAYDLGADVVIAVDLQGDYVGRAKRFGFDPDTMRRQNMVVLKTARAGWSLALKSLGQAAIEQYKPEVIITPKIGHIDMGDFTKAEELIVLGMEATKAILPSIHALLTKKSRA
ncbi:patatin-like phospholipase family protein [Kordiimonas pumila]|uniref:Patatin-like phospholipase family protein n=1 Tax=Kordiimonas pumila TaxID=2161677 RepID=A0ABV7D1A1_9PROT|nr:patatin-like phospholipase family protein [Kordiimonas pumila]